MLFRIEVNEAYQENNRDVEHESNRCIQEEREDADVVDRLHGHAGDLGNKSNNTVHRSASRSEVVKRDQGVHLEFGRAQKTLDHGQSDGLKRDSTNLVEETQQVEFDLSERGNDDTNDDERDVAKSL